MGTLIFALNYVLNNEGGYSDNPNDSGGATNYGITLAVAQRFGIETKEALKNITMDMVTQIYRKDYWFMDGIKENAVATKFFDMVVNMGAHRATTLLQRACMSLQGKLVVDGSYGPKTEKVVNCIDHDLLLSALVDQCITYYKGRVDAKPSNGVFLKGWLIRARRIPR